MKLLPMLIWYHLLQERICRLLLLHLEHIPHLLILVLNLVNSSCKVIVVSVTIVATVMILLARQHVHPSLVRPRHRLVFTFNRVDVLTALIANSTTDLHKVNFVLFHILCINKMRLDMVVVVDRVHAAPVILTPHTRDTTITTIS